MVEADGRHLAGGAERRSIVRILILAWFALYLAGLLGWLGIGLLPTLADHISAFRQALLSEAAGHGVWARLAGRIADRTMLMGGLGTVIVQSLFSLLNLALGGFLLFRRPFERVPQLLILALLGTAATFNSPSHQVFHVLGEPPPIQAIHYTFHIISGTAYLWAVFLFPDGRFPPGTIRSVRLRWILGAGVTVAIAVVCWRSSFVSHPPFFVGFFGVLTPVIGIPATTVRMRQTTDREVRQQCRLLRGALLPSAAVAAVWVVAWVVSLTGTSGAAGAHHLDGILENWFPAAFAVVPVVLFIGVLRYRLWDIDVVISRALLYLSLGGCALAGYVAVVSVAGTLAPGWWSTALVMAAVALGIDPLRRRLQRAANRVVFGQVLTPAEAVRSLADGLAQVKGGNSLAELVQAAAVGTRAAEASLWVAVDDHLLEVARWPESGRHFRRRTVPLSSAAEEISPASVDADRFEPISYRDRRLGGLALNLHPGVPLPPQEERLIAELAGHAGLLVHNAQLAAQLARELETLEAGAEELRRSLRALVAAQDTERRGLERNIHDGAQQELVAILIMVRTLLARAHAHSAGAGNAPDAGRAQGEAHVEVDDAVAELASMTVSTTDNLERLCGGGLPAVLVDRGPGPALDATAAPLRRAGMEVVVLDRTDARAPLDVEAAVYFCALEAVQNAAKHARATRLDVQLDAFEPDSRYEGGFEFSVRDDGIGFDPTALGEGSGLENLVSRLAVLGGTVTVESAPGHGTTVRGRVAIPSRGPDEREMVLR
ncbi:MAG: ATP-binding protein [Acidimicrobiaceae bacterium]|nr:ATP-binding protein [Acidimicrobiaceae bacterium]